LTVRSASSAAARRRPIHQPAPSAAATAARITTNAVRSKVMSLESEPVEQLLGLREDRIRLPGRGILAFGQVAEARHEGNHARVPGGLHVALGVADIHALAWLQRQQARGM